MHYGRGENRIKDLYNMSDMYKQYKEEHADNPLYEVDNKTFYAICSEFNSAVVDAILRDGKKFIMPYSIGSIHISKYKPKLEDIRKRTSFIDWQNTAKLGKIVYHLNEHSDGFKYNIKWEKKKNVLRYIDIYKFVPTREFKRTLARLIKSRETDYFENE